MDWVLVGVFIALLFVCLVLDLRLVYYFEHEDDSGLSAQEVVAKCSALLGLQLTWMAVLGLPLDVYNLHSPLADAHATAGLDMHLYWRVLVWFVALYVLLALPLSSFYYEADTDKRLHAAPPWRRSLLLTFVSVCTVALVGGLCYFFLKALRFTASEELCKEALPVGESSWLQSICETLKEDEVLSVNATADFSVYLAAVLASLGWLPFAVFGGIGLLTLPLDLTLSLQRRVAALPQPAFLELRGELGKKARLLRRVGEALDRREQNAEGKNDASLSASKSSGWWPSPQALRQAQKSRALRGRFKQAALGLEEEFRALVEASRQREESRLWAALKVVLGVCAAALSSLVVCHVLLFFFVPQWTGAAPAGFMRFLDWILQSLAQKGAALAALVLYSVIGVYLLICVLKGCVSLGMKMCGWCSLHPLRKDGTRLNSILFNVGLAALSSMALVQFSSTAFEGYARGSEARWLFNVQFAFFPFFGAFYKFHLFEYLLVLSFIGAAVGEVCGNCCSCKGKGCKGRRRRLGGHGVVELKAVDPILLAVLDGEETQGAEGGAVCTLVKEEEPLTKTGPSDALLFQTRRQDEAQPGTAKTTAASPSPPRRKRWGRLDG